MRTAKQMSVIDKLKATEIVLRVGKEVLSAVDAEVAKETERARKLGKERFYNKKR